MTELTPSFFDIIPPWIALLITLFPLLFVRRWLLRHLFGLGYLVGKERSLATLLFYLTLLPGILLHEISRYLFAGIFRIVPTNITIYPEEQDDGTFELGFVQFGFIINPIYRVMMDLIPFAVGLLAVNIIGDSILHWPDIGASIRGGDIYVIGDTLGKILGRGDFILWSYVLFGIANTMMPSKREARGLFIILGLLLIFAVIMVAVGFYEGTIRLLTGPVANALYALSGVFATVLILDIIASAVIWGLEKVLVRLTNRQVDYGQAKSVLQKAAKAQLPKSVFELALPVPAAPGKQGYLALADLQKEQAKKRLPVQAAPAQPVPQPSMNRPTIEKPAQPALSSPERPALAGGSSTSGNRGLPSGVSTPASTDKPATPFSKPAAASTSGSPFAKPAASASTTEPTTVDKPASPFGKPAAASTSGSPFAKPAASTSTTEPTTVDKPASPFGKPAAASTSGSPFAKPAASASTTEPTTVDKPASPFGKPAAASTSGSPFAKPATGSNLPARPTFGAPAPASNEPPAAPKNPTLTRPPTGTPFSRPPMSPAPKANISSVAKPSSEEDVIDGEVIDDVDYEDIDE